MEQDLLTDEQKELAAQGLTVEALEALYADKEAGE